MVKHTWVLQILKVLALLLRAYPLARLLVRISLESLCLWLIDAHNG